MLLCHHRAVPTYALVVGPTVMPCFSLAILKGDFRCEFPPTPEPLSTMAAPRSPPDSCLQVEEGAFVKENFDELCWTLTAKKNYKPDRNGNSVVSHQDAFKLWCLFNFLSEDKYPLVMVPDEVGPASPPSSSSLQGSAHRQSPVWG